MNKKDLEVLREEKEDEEKLMECIHDNAQKHHDRYIMNNNIRKIKQEKREKNNKRITYTVLTILALLTLFLAAKYDEYTQEECKSNGYSEGFCEANLR